MLKWLSLLARNTAWGDTTRALYLLARILSVCSYVQVASGSVGILC